MLNERLTFCGGIDEKKKYGGSDPCSEPHVKLTGHSCQAIKHHQIFHLYMPPKIGDFLQPLMSIDNSDDVEVHATDTP